MKTGVRSLLWEWGRIAAALLALAGSTVWVLMLMEERRPAKARAAELSYLPKGEYLKIAVLGYDHIVADLLWLKAIQHFSGRRQTQENYLWAYHATDVLTDLDPKFILAYKAAGTILGVWGSQVEESVAILRKGIAHNPDSWELHFILGYDYFYELCDRATAADHLRAASVIPGAPEYLPRLAARMTVDAGNPETALEFLGRLYARTQDPEMRESLAQRMKEVIAERDIRFLEEGIRRYASRYGSKPVSLRALVTGGIIERVPEDPLGGRYVLDHATGSVTSSGLQERLRVHMKVNPRIPCHLRMNGHR